MTAPVPLAVYLGASVEDLTLVVSNQDTGVNGTPGDDARFRRRPARRIASASTPRPTGSPPSSCDGHRHRPTTTWPTRPSSPASPGSWRRRPGGATEQYGVEPEHNTGVGVVAGNSVWFTFTPTVRGAYEALAGSSVDDRSVEWYADDGKGGVEKPLQTDVCSSLARRRSIICRSSHGVLIPAGPDPFDVLRGRRADDCATSARQS